MKILKISLLMVLFFMFLIPFNLFSTHSKKKNIGNVYLLTEINYISSSDRTQWELVSSKATEYNWKKISISPKNVKQEFSIVTNTTEIQGSKPSCYLSSIDELIIECNGLIPNKILIVDLLGKVIFSETFSNKEDNILLDVNRFSSGFYYILMFSKDGNIHTLNFLRN